MKRLQRKIEVLNKTANRLLKPETNYDWERENDCNCGHIVLSCGVKPETLIDRVGPLVGFWSDSVDSICSVSGKPFKEVFTILYQNGFKQKDIGMIEWCTNKGVLVRMGVTKQEEGNPVFVAFYFYAWADMLEEKLEIKKAIKESKQLTYEKS